MPEMSTGLAHESLSIYVGIVTYAGIVTRSRMPVRAALLTPLPFKLGELAQH